MANGLRKLIRKARRFSNSNLNRRINRIGPRLRVEELEERIAPATLDLAPGEYAVWDTAGGTGETFDATDGIIYFGSNSTAGLTLQISQFDTAVGNDTVTLNLSITGDTAGDGAKALYIVSNQTIGTVSVAGLDVQTDSIQLMVYSGYDFPVAAAGTVDPPNIDGIDTGNATQEATNAADGNVYAVGNDNYGALANAAIGALTLATSDAEFTDTDVAVDLHLDTSGTGGMGSITQSDSGLNLVGTTNITADSLGAVSWDGDVIPGANNVTINIANAITSFDMGGVTLDNTGHVNIDAGTNITGTADFGVLAGSGSSGDLLVDTATGIGGLAFTSVTLANTHQLSVDVSGGNIGAASYGTFASAATASSNVTASGTLGSQTFTSLALTSSGNFTVTGESIGAISTTSATLGINTTSSGDVIFTANGAAALGKIASIQTAGGGLTTANAGGLIDFRANDGIGETAPNINIVGDVGGTAGAVNFLADYLNGGTAEAGDIGPITVASALGNGGSNVTISGVNVAAIQADNIGTGSGAVQITADDGADTDGGTATGVVSTITVTNDMASGSGGVTIDADDGVGDLTVTGETALGGNVTINTNLDGNDDTGAMGAVSSQVLGDASDATGVVSINTNGGAADNTTERPVGTIDATDGNAHLSLVIDGNVAQITVSGGDGSNGNELTLDNLNLNAAGDPTNAPNVVGINVVDIATENDLLTLTAGGTFVIPGTLGPIVSGGSDAGDVLDINNNTVQVYAGDTPSAGFAVVWTGGTDSAIDITCGFFQTDAGATGTIQANTQAASDLFRLVEGTNVTRVTAASGVTADILFDLDGGNEGGDPAFVIADLAGTSSADDLEIISEDGTDVDLGLNGVPGTPAILPATDGNVDVKTILIGGDLLNDIGSGALGFDDVDLIIIQGTDGANDFFGSSLRGYASQTGTLGLAGVDVLALDTSNDGTDDIVIQSGVAGSIFVFADAAGAAPAVDQFNHRVAVPGGVAGATATLRGVDGDGTLDEYEISGTGDSGQPLDPAGIFPANTYAMIHRIMLSGTGGLTTDVSVREVDGTTNGSFMEFETDVGLVYLTTQLDTLSVGIDDGSDLVDNAVLTGISFQGNTRANFDRLGGGQGGSSKRGLEPATTVSDDDALLGNFIAASMGNPGAANINVVVTGDSGPITLTGDFTLETSDIGSLTTNGAGSNGAAIAIGGNQQGAITVPGDVWGDILIGIGLDVNSDTDLEDATDVAPGGSLNADVVVGDMWYYDIQVYDDVTGDIVITGYDNNPEYPGLDDDGDLRGVKAGGDLGVLGTNVIVVNTEINYIIADGALNSGIFSGGEGSDSVVVEGTTINGPIVLGAANGIDSLEIIDHEVYGDVGDSDSISGAQMTIQIAAGAIGDGTDAVGDIYVQDSISGITVTSSSGDAINIGNIFTLYDGSFYVETPADVGVIVAAEGVNILTSEQLQDLITTSYDVVDSPTGLDTDNVDDDDYVAYSGWIDAVNAGGVVAEGSISIDDAEILGSFGYIVSLYGYLDDVYVCAEVSIGSIVSSESIHNGEFRSEGTLGVGVGTMETDLTAWGLAAGVPSWFYNSGGGVLAEAGNLDNVDFIANGGFALTQGTGVAAGQAMGTFYLMAGSIESDCSIICGGSMGGIQAPTGAADMLFQVSMDGNIDRIIVAQWSPATSTTPTTDSYWNADRVAIFVVGESGDNVIVAGNPLTIDSIEISVTGANTLAIYTSSNDIMLVGGLESGSSLVVNGDVPGGDLIVDGDWAGLVDFNPNANTGDNGEVEYITVNGDIVSGADLDAYNFGCLEVQGSIASSVLDGGTLSNTNRVDDLTMLDDTNVQTLYLKGSNKVTAVWNSVFGKVTGYTVGGVDVKGVEFVGKGKADFATNAGTSAISEIQMKDFVKAGAAPAGVAHIGDMSMAVGSNVNLKNVLVPGELDSLTNQNNVGKLLVSGNVGAISVGNAINNAFIGGCVDEFGARIAKNVVINGSVDEFSAWKVVKTKVFGVTDDLTITGNQPGGGAHGRIINSYFVWVNDANFGPTYPDSNVRVVRSVIGGLYEVQDNPLIEQNYYGYY